MSEASRLAFITERDRNEAALDFAKRTFAEYRRCLRFTGRDGKKFHHASIRQYRRKFIESCLTFRRYLREAA